MVDAFGLSDVSTKDTGKGSKLKTGGRRKHNMPSKEVCAKKYGAGTKAYKDCVSYKLASTQKPIQTKQEESDLMGLPAAQNARTRRRNKRNAAKNY